MKQVQQLGVVFPTLFLTAILAVTVGCDSNVHPCEADADCTAYEDQPVCDVEAGFCVPEGGGEGEGEEGEGEGEGEGTCEDGDLDDAACLSEREGGDPQLCDGTDCVDPNELTADCADADGAPAYDGGPIIYAVDGPSAPEDDGTCATIRSWDFDVYSEVPFDDDAALVQNLTNGTPGATYQAPIIVDVVDNEYLITVYLCAANADSGFAVMLTDNEGNDGNAFCF